METAKTTESKEERRGRERQDHKKGRITRVNERREESGDQRKGREREEERKARKEVDE